MKKLIILTIGILLLLASNCFATTYYIRTDGGTGSQCDGTHDAAQSGAVDGADAGSTPDCALNHPNWVFPPRGESTARLAANGDTVVISSGSYRIGCQNASNCRDSLVNLTSSSYCSAGGSYDCFMSNGGTSEYDGTIANNVTVVGCTTAGCGCTAAPNGVVTCSTTRPELWGAGRIRQVLNVQYTTGVTLKDLDITDHDDCAYNNSLYSCSAGSKENELTTFNGIRLIGASNLTILNTRIHGVYAVGLFGHVGGGVVLNGVDSSYNALSGWDLDDCYSAGNCGSSGTNTISNSNFSWNGCVEDNPGYGTIKSQGCYSQTQGGYGDGFGSGNTGGNWVFTDTAFNHNTSDGLDLLYHNRGGYSGGTVSLKRVHIEGNTGDAMKTSNALTVEDSIIIANCGFFYGKSFTQTANASFDYCRSNTGSAIKLEFHDNVVPKIYNNTIASNGDVTIITTASCTAGINVLTKNNIIIGGRQWNDDTSLPPGAGGENQNTDIFYNSDTCQATFVDDYNICTGSFKTGSPCPGAHSLQNQSNSSTFTGTITQGPTTYYAGNDYSVELGIKVGSPARNVSDTSLSGTDSLDYNAFSRGVVWDAGALEYGSTNSGTSPNCGNATLNTGETCDGDSQLNGQTCSLQGFTSGTLHCNSTCTGYDTSSCVTSLCGNSVINGTEQCDTANLNGATCGSTGYSSCSGTPGCSSCVLTQGTCIAKTCGNSCTDSGEGCDDGNTTNSDGCSSICETEVSPYEKLLTYTDGDSATYIDTHTNLVNYTGMTRNADAYLRYDYGASHFGDFTQRFTARIDTCNDNGTVGAIAGVWAMSTGARTSLKDMLNNTDGSGLYMYCLSHSSSYQWTLFGNGTLSGAATLNDAIPTITRYIEMGRTGSTLTAKIYSDATYTTQVGSTMTMSDSHAYRYFYPVSSLNNSTSGTTISGSNSNYDLTYGTATTQTENAKSVGCSISGGVLK